MDVNELLEERGNGASVSFPRQIPRPTYTHHIDPMRDECKWAYHLQKFGQRRGYASRLLFMRCLETNMVKKKPALSVMEQGLNLFRQVSREISGTPAAGTSAGAAQAPSDDNRPTHPMPDHELYVVVSYGGGSLRKLQLETAEQAVIIIGELIGALKFLSLAGVIHHDLKGDNIMYSENVAKDGAAVGGHIVGRPRGGD